MNEIQTAAEDLIDKGISQKKTESVKGSGRTVNTHQMRTSRAKLYAFFEDNPVLCQAAYCIGEAIELRSKGWGFALLGIKTSAMDKTPGGGHYTEEIITSIREKIGNLHKWEFSTKPEWVMSVKAIEEHSLTANEYARRISCDPSTIMRWYKNGLNEYSITVGWGDQISS